MTLIRKASRSEPLIKQILKATFPEYKGRKIRISSDLYPMDLSSYWSDGSKNYYKFYQPDTNKVFAVDSLTAPWKQISRTLDPEKMPESVVLVEHIIFCGQDMGIVIYVKEPKMLEEKTNGSRA